MSNCTHTGRSISVPLCPGRAKRGRCNLGVSHKYKVTCAESQRAALLQQERMEEMCQAHPEKSSDLMDKLSNFLCEILGRKCSPWAPLSI